MNLLMGPLVSIYLTTKNRRSLLERAVDSILRQTYTNWELIIIDDASTDDTSLFLESLKEKIINLKIIVNDISLGACHCRNKAIAHASGKFITGLDDDDYFKENRLEIFVKNSEFLENKLVAMIYSGNYLITEKTQSTIIHHDPICSARDLLYSNKIGNQIFAKIETLREFPFDTNFLAWQDLDCWYSILSKSNRVAIGINEATYFFDHHDRQDRITLSKRETILKTYEQFSLKHHLSFREKNILRNHLHWYKIDDINLTYILKMFYSTLDIRLLKIIVKKYLKLKVQVN